MDLGSVLDGRYRLDALLGEGGMGAVYRATHLQMDRRVAIKLLKPHLTANDTALQRFLREARVTMRVDSPHAVKLFDFGITSAREYYMVLEYVDGRTVQRELDVDGAFAPPRVLHIAKQALHALGAAHASGLIHRDIKPENIMLTAEGDDPDFAKLLDFGVAKLMDGAARSDKSALKITQAGMVFGTPEYMSPEQACGLALDPRSDLYSLAATMFAMLTGCALFVAKTSLEWLTLHATKSAPHLPEARPELAAYPELDRVLQRCLSKQRDARPANAAEMARLLDEVASTLSRPASTAGPPAASTNKGLRAAASTFVAVLPRDVVAATTGATPVKRRSGVWLVLGALIVLGMVGGAIYMATRSRVGVGVGVGVGGSGSPTPTPTPTPDAVIAEVPTDAAPPPADAARVAKPVEHPPDNSEAMRHVVAAEEAMRTGNRLRQIAEADAALRTDPHNLRARYLLGDGLIATGDLDRGCKYLRDLGRNPTARARAHQAGCPGD